MRVNEELKVTTKPRIMLMICNNKWTVKGCGQLNHTHTKVMELLNYFALELSIRELSIL